MGLWGALCTGSANQVLIRQLSVEFLIGEVSSWCALTSFVVDSVAILGLARDFGDTIIRLFEDVHF